MFNRHQQLDPNFNIQNLTVYWSSIGIDANATVSSLICITCHIKGSGSSHLLLMLCCKWFATCPLWL